VVKLGVDEMPPVETAVGDTIGYHNRKGGHSFNSYDWQQFLDSQTDTLASKRLKNNRTYLNKNWMII